MTTAGAARRRALVLRSIHRGGGVHLSEEWTSDPCGSRSTSVLRLPVVRGRRASVFAINAAGKAEILVRDIPADLEVNARAAAHECPSAAITVRASGSAQ
ncbi:MULTISPECIES: ferredoxin [Mycobacteriaceae]|uniref:Ferredoxin n=1 Tax=Mycolicibacterium parafortuitum TaxID=39692 RepID=A0ACC6MQ51_MYCPF|nr:MULTISPECIES: ferredoxin [Mycobacteriaceae]MDZ5089131.1 ferredoxin [Mycolicibacterium parafortuitum]